MGRLRKGGMENNISQRVMSFTGHDIISVPELLICLSFKQTIESHRKCQVTARRERENERKRIGGRE